MSLTKNTILKFVPDISEPASPPSGVQDGTIPIPKTSFNGAGSGYAEPPRLIAFGPGVLGAYLGASAVRSDTKYQNIGLPKQSGSLKA